MTSPDNQPEAPQAAAQDVEQRIQRLIDGDLTAEELAALETELMESPEAMETYRAYLDLDCALEEQIDGEREVSSQSVVPVDRIVAMQRRFHIKVATLGAAAIVLLAAVGMWILDAPENQPPLTKFRIAPGSDFTLTHSGEGDAPAGKTMVEGSRLSLLHGVAELKLPHDVRAVVEAPAEMVLRDDRTLELIHGRALFQVNSKDGQGFTLVTPHQRIVDLGTSFGIDLPEGRDEIELHVLKGQVRVDSKDGKHGETIKATRAVQLAGTQVLREIDNPSIGFLRNLPPKINMLVNEDFATGLIAGQNYVIRMDPYVIRDLSGKAFGGIDDDTTWNFRTASLSTALVAADMNVGGLDTGFDDGFHKGSKHVFITDAPDLVYPKYGITQTGTIEKVYAANAGSDRQDLRDLATAMTGEIWFSVLVNVPDGTTYAGLTFNSRGKAYDPVATDARILMTPSHIQVGLKGGAATQGNGIYTAGKTHLLLGKMKVVSGNDTLSIWVDPDLTTLRSPDALPAASFTSTTVNFADSITQLGVAGRSGSNASNVMIDAIRLSNQATAFSDVTGVRTDPEGAVAQSSDLPGKTALSIVRMKAIHGNSDVASDDKLVLTFSEPIQRGSGDVIIRNFSTGDMVETIPITSGQLSIRHSELTIRPGKHLGDDYSVEITAGAITDFSGNPFSGITADAALNRLQKESIASTPAASNNDTPPIFIAAYPADDSTSGTRDGQLRMLFDKPIKLGPGRVFIQNITNWDESVLVFGDHRLSIDDRMLMINPPIKLKDGIGSLGWLAGWKTDAPVTFLNPRGDGKWYDNDELQDDSPSQGMSESMHSRGMTSINQPIRREIGTITAESRYTVSAAIGVRAKNAKNPSTFLGYTIRMKSGDTVLAQLTSNTPPGPPSSVNTVSFSWDATTLPDGVQPGDPLSIEIIPNRAKDLTPGYLDLNALRISVLDRTGK
jgi:ferric-dicitrate binding protein FerR (iron transport regulator)